MSIKWPLSTGLKNIRKSKNKSIMTREKKTAYRGSTLTFEGTCQVGQVNLIFYLPDTIVTYPAKSVIEWTGKWLFCVNYTCIN